MRRRLFASLLGASALALGSTLTLVTPASAADLQMSADRSAARPGDSVLISGSGCAQDDGQVWITFPGAFGSDPVVPTQSVPEVAEDGSWTFLYRVPLALTGTAEITATCIGYLDTTEFPSVTVTVDPAAVTGVEVVQVRPSGECSIAVTVRASVPGGWFFGPIHSERRRAAQEQGIGDFDPIGLLERDYFDLLPGQTRDLTWEVSPAALAERPAGFHVSQLRTDNSVVEVLSLPWSTVPAELRSRCLGEATGGTPASGTSTIPASTSSTGSTVAGKRALSATGVDVEVGLGVGFAVLLAGAGLVLVARRRLT